MEKTTVSTRSQEPRHPYDASTKQLLSGPVFGRCPARLVTGIIYRLRADGKRVYIVYCEGQYLPVEGAWGARTSGGHARKGCRW